jgi:UrcA family protein
MRGIMIKSLIAPTALAAALSLTSVAFAQPEGAYDPPRQAVVKFADLNIMSPLGAEVLNRRIEVAARSACGPEPTLRDLRSSRAFRDCVSHAQASGAELAQRAIATTRLAAAR